MDASTPPGHALPPNPGVFPPAQTKNANRPIFSGLRLPTADNPMSLTPHEYKAIGDKHLSPARKAYLDYMLLGIYPQGPFDGSTGTAATQATMDGLIEVLTMHRQYSALIELIQECDPLNSLHIEPDPFTRNSLAEFLDTLARYQSGIRCIKIAVPTKQLSEHDASEKATALANFVERSPALKKFDLVGINDKFSGALIDAISHQGNAEVLRLGFVGSLSDPNADKLCELFCSCTHMRSVTLESPDLSEKKSQEIFSSLQRCAQLTELAFSGWSFSSYQTCCELRDLLTSSKTLKTFSCIDYYASPAASDSVGRANRLVSLRWGILNSPSLIAVTVGGFKAADQYKCLESLFSALDLFCKVRQMTLHGMNLNLPADTGCLQSLARLLKRKTNIIEINGIFPEAEQRDSALFQQHQENYALCKDRLARNKAIASGEMAKIFSNAFFPSPGSLPGVNHIGDPGIVLTEHLLIHSPSVPDFRNTMVEVALSIDETARREAESPSVIRQTNEPAMVMHKSTNNKQQGQAEYQ